MKVLLVALIAAFFTTPALAQECRNNMEWDRWEQKLKTEYGVTNPTPIFADSRLVFLSQYNNTPPVSNITAPDIYLIANSQLGIVLALFVDGACVVHGDTIPLELVTSWLSGKSA